MKVILLAWMIGVNKLRNGCCIYSGSGGRIFRIIELSQFLSRRTMILWLVRHLVLQNIYLTSHLAFDKGT